MFIDWLAFEEASIINYMVVSCNQLILINRVVENKILSFFF